MFPESDLIIACPHCEAACRLRQLTSENNAGAITWTDGWMDAPLMPRAPRISRCAGCTKIFWVAFADQLGFATEPGDEWSNAPDLGFLKEAECFEALKNGLAETPELELELRVFTWWRGNDAFREPFHSSGFPTSPEAIANIDRMIELTEFGEEDLLLFRAEAQRHLGRFDDALGTLQGVGCSDYWPAKSRQLELIEAKSRGLAILFSPNRPPILAENG